MIRTLESNVSKKLYSAILALLLCGVALGQNGTIKGVVQTKQDSVAIWGASIYISGTVHNSYSEEDGTFILESVPPGTYDISTEDFTTGDSALTRGIVVLAGDTTFVTVKVGVSVKLGEVIEISYEQPKAATVAAAIEEEKTETKVTTVVSSADFKAKGDSKVTDAAKRASGVTVEGGKYVYVRGLSDRYSKTLLDGTEIPGLDPNRNAVQLDMFPTNFVQSLKVIKSFTPDLPGDFVGGLVDIRTKEFPDSLEIAVSAGMKYNTQASFNSDFLTSSKGSTDFLGYDDGSRQIPTTIRNFINRGDFPEYGEALFKDEVAEDLELVMDALNDEMVPVRNSSFTPFNFGATIGNTLKFNQKGDSLGLKTQRKLGYLVGMNYRSSLNYFNQGATNVYDLSGSLTEKEELTALRIMNMESASQEVLIGLIGKLGFEFNDNHKLNFSFLKNQSGKQTVTAAEGENIDDDFYYRSKNIAYLERAMNNFILSGEHKIVTRKKSDKPGSFTLDWAGAYTLSAQEEPDLRFFNDNLDENGNPEFREQNYTGPVRYWRAMNEINKDVKVNLTFPFELSKDRTLKLKAGGSYVTKERVFDEKRLDYALGSEANYDGSVAAFLADENTGYLGDDGIVLNNIGVYAINQTNIVNNYTGTSTIASGYGMGELPLSTRFTAVVGARVEATDINVESESPAVESSTLVKTSVLPSVNLSYDLIDGKKVQSKKDSTVTYTRDMKIRLSFNQTLARPNFRELAPFAVEDFVNNSVIIGNPALQLTDVKNYDIRWEYYPKSGEQISVSAFYKDFTNPIEQITNATAANIEFTWVNNAKGRLYGMEFEGRKKLDFISEQLKAFEVSGNLTLVQSSSDVDTSELALIRGNDPEHADTRPLFGQSPYIINATLSYSNDSADIKANVAFNIFGDRLVLVTKGGLPDIYELSRPSLDFNLSKTFKKRLKITFRAKNLLDPEYKQVFKIKTESADYAIKPDNESFIFRNYKRGRNFSISVSYKF